MGSRAATVGWPQLFFKRRRDVQASETELHGRSGEFIF